MILEERIYRIPKGDQRIYNLIPRSDQNILPGDDELSLLGSVLMIDKLESVPGLPPAPTTVILEVCLCYLKLPMPRSEPKTESKLSATI